MAIPALRAILFDVDGTLAETEEFHRRAFNLAFDEAGLDWHWDEDLYLDLLAVTGGKERMLVYAARQSEACLAQITPLIPALHKRKTAFYTDFVAQGAIPLRPGMRELIEEAQRAGLRLAISTTTSIENVEALMHSTLGAGWRSIFPIVAAGDMVPKKKPAPDVYHLAMERLGLAPQACIAIEDSRNGVRAARAAGLRVLAVRSTYCRNDDLTGAAQIYPDTAMLTLNSFHNLIRH